MELIFPALSILVLNLAASIVLAIIKDVINSVLHGETQLVLQKLSTNRNPARTDTPYVEISGRRAGLIGYLLTLFDLSPKVSLLAFDKEVRKSASSLHGHSLEVIPLSPSVSVQSVSQRSLFWLVAAIFCMTAGVGSGLLLGKDFPQKLLNGLSWLVAAGIYLFAFYQSHSFQLIVHGTTRAGVSFKPSVIEGRGIDFQEVAEAVDVLVERIQETRVSEAPPASPPEAYLPPSMPMYVPPSGTYQPSPTAYVPAPTGHPQGQPPGPAKPFAPAQHPGIDDGEETISQPAPAANANAKTKAAKEQDTGTVEYGDEIHPVFPSAKGGKWEGGPEPGTSDSIQLRQSITRSETGMFLGVPPNLNDLDYEDDEMDDHLRSSNGGTHRGTVSWEEQADKTQDEVRAEAELAELKKSRPKRGEAKLRLRELMRRFPQTEAASKARRMLERLESGE